MGEVVKIPAVNYYKQAEEMLKKKELVKFVENISIARVLAEGQDDLLADVTFLKVQGLYRLNRRKEALENISESLRYNTGERAIKIRHYEGVIYGYLGEIKRAEKIFKDLLTQADDMNSLVELYFSLSWIYLTLDQKTDKEERLTQAKKYLELCDECFDNLSDRLKCKLFTHYSVYYFYLEDFEKSIELAEQAIQYAREEELPQLYNNLAEIYLKEDQDGVSKKVYEYGDKAEVIASKYQDDIQIGKSFYIRATAELREEQMFTALDTLYLAFEYYKNAEAYPHAFDTLVKINDIMDTYKNERLTSLKDKLIEDLKGTAYYEKL